MMKKCNLAMIALGLFGTILATIEKLPAYGLHGMIVMGACLVPVGLGAVGAVTGRLPRWASAICAISFLIAALKSRGADSLRGIMLAAVAGLLVSLALIIKPLR